MMNNETLTLYYYDELSAAKCREVEAALREGLSEVFGTEPRTAILRAPASGWQA